MAIPGRNVETIMLPSSSILPRTQLRRPIPDIVKDINRKSRAVITMANGPGGQLKFEASGPQDKAQQALRDLVSQIGRKVSTNALTITCSTTLTDKPMLGNCHYFDPAVCQSSHHWQTRLHYQIHSREIWRENTDAQN
jgi:hypothetical protein